MRIDPAGWPFVLAGAGVALVMGLVSGAPAGLVSLILPGFFLFFFRDPERRHDAPAHAVLAPADGRVMVAGPPTAATAPPGATTQISIFLSPLDVHVNRMPVGGRVTRVEHQPGRFLAAYRFESGDRNERTEVAVEHHGQQVIVRQIVGVLARRIVCRTAVGREVAAGERFGLMKFGSRMDVFLPAGAVVATRVGDRVVGGVTVIATLGTTPEPAPAAELETSHVP
jgi:phosphatidylserine decarboxylase